MSEDAFSQGNMAFVNEDYQGALKLFDEAIDKDDSNAMKFCSRAAVHLKLGNMSDALTDANSAVQLDSSNKLGYFRKGQAYYALKDYKLAKEALNTARKLGDINCEDMLAHCHTELGTTPEGDAVAAEEAVKAAQVAPTPQATPVEPPTANQSASQRIRHDWYQTADYIIVSIMIKKVDPETVTIEFTGTTMSCDIKLLNGSNYNLELDLCYKVDPDQCKYFVRSTKVEVKMKKKASVQWPALEGQGLDGNEGPGVNMTAIAAVDTKPVGYDTEKKWTQLAKEAEEQEKEEKKSGDAALNSLFQQIYGDADEDTRRAMNKSFQESGGTVLSTNWNEIGAKKTDIKPPDGMVHKKWEES